MTETSVTFLSHTAPPTDENENIACVETREPLYNGSKIANNTKAQLDKEIDTVEGKRRKKREKKIKANTKLYILGKARECHRKTSS